MTIDLLDLADRIWRGEATVEDHNPFAISSDLVEIAARTGFVASFANVSAFLTDDGLVLVDTGSPFLAGRVHEAIRGWSPDRLNTAIYSHGHIDHVFGVPHFDEEASAQDRPPPRVVAHEAVSRRFDRYLETAGYNSIINQRQFRTPVQWPTQFRYPDQTYHDRLDLEVGGEPFELHHARGETDDHTWTWVPGRKVLACGDFFIWVSPNCGNPQKAQRYPKEWALALRTMAALPAEVLLPGHGLPIIGNARVREALSNTAALLESLLEQTLSLMNQGVRLDQIIHEVKAPENLLEKPYLHPIYDEPEFIVRNIWRLYGGWYDGNPANLKPASEANLAAEIARLAGGPQRLAARALEVADEGDLRVASHLVEMAALAAPEDPSVHSVRAEIFERRVAAEASLMSKGIFTWAASESLDTTRDGGR